MRLDFGDASRAYFHAWARRRAFVDFPPEDYEEGKRGRLAKARHGARDAVQKWELERVETLVEAGLRQGPNSPRGVFRSDRIARLVARRNDFTALGRRRDLVWLRGVAWPKIEIKFKSTIQDTYIHREVKLD